MAVRFYAEIGSGKSASEYEFFAGKNYVES